MDRRTAFGVLISITLISAVSVLDKTVAASGREPVIFLPGILGSRLVDQYGEAVWDANAWFTDASDIEKLRLLEGPSRGRLHPSGIIANDFTLFGSLKSGPYQPFIDCLASNGYTLGQDLFLFPYDWRLSNFYSAAQLSQFIDGLGLPQSSPISIVGHSMGGLVGMIYLQRFAKADRRNRLITVGTPFRGSLDALYMLYRGPWDVSRWIGMDATETAEVIGSFESLYEIVPLYDECCLEDTGDELVPIDLMDYVNWLRLNMLPLEYTRDPGLAVLKNGLERRKEIRELSARPLARNASLVRIANDFLSTRERLVASGFPKDYKWVPGFKGDGTVMAESALDGNLRIVVRVTQNHSNLFSSSRICNEIVDAIDDGGGLPKQVSPRVRDATGNSRNVGSVEYDIGSAYKGLGNPAWARISAFDEQGDRIEGLEIEGYVRDATGDQSDLSFVENEGIYTARFVVPYSAGIHRVVAVVPQLGDFTDHYLAIQAPKHLPDFWDQDNDSGLGATPPEIF